MANEQITDGKEESTDVSTYVEPQELRETSLEPQEIEAIQEPITRVEVDNPQDLPPALEFAHDRDVQHYEEEYHEEERPIEYRSHPVEELPASDVGRDILPFGGLSDFGGIPKFTDANKNKLTVGSKSSSLIKLPNKKDSFMGVMGSMFGSTKKKSSKKESLPPLAITNPFAGLVSSGLSTSGTFGVFGAKSFPGVMGKNKIVDPTSINPLGGSPPTIPYVDGIVERKLTPAQKAADTRKRKSANKKAQDAIDGYNANTTKTADTVASNDAVRSNNIKVKKESIDKQARRDSTLSWFNNKYAVTDEDMARNFGGGKAADRFAFPTASAFVPHIGGVLAIEPVQSGRTKKNKDLVPLTPEYKYQQSMRAPLRFGAPDNPQSLMGFDLKESTGITLDDYNAYKDKSALEADGTWGGEMLAEVVGMAGTPYASSKNDKIVRSQPKRVSVSDETFYKNIDSERAAWITAHQGAYEIQKSAHRQHDTKMKKMFGQGEYYAMVEKATGKPYKPFYSDYNTSPPPPPPEEPRKEGREDGKKDDGKGGIKKKRFQGDDVMPELMALPPGAIAGESWAITKYGLSGRIHKDTGIVDPLNKTQYALIKSPIDAADRKKNAASWAKIKTATLERAAHTKERNAYYTAGLDNLVKQQDMKKEEEENLLNYWHWTRVKEQAGVDTENAEIQRKRDKLTREWDDILLIESRKKASDARYVNRKQTKRAENDIRDFYNEMKGEEKRKSDNEKLFAKWRTESTKDEAKNKGAYYRDSTLGGIVWDELTKNSKRHGKGADPWNYAMRQKAMGKDANFGDSWKQAHPILTKAGAGFAAGATSRYKDLTEGQKARADAAAKERSGFYDGFKEATRRYRPQPAMRAAPEIRSMFGGGGRGGGSRGSLFGMPKRAYPTRRTRAGKYVLTAAARKSMAADNKRARKENTKRRKSGVLDFMNLFG